MSVDFKLLPLYMKGQNDIKIEVTGKITDDGVDMKKITDTTHNKIGKQ